MACQAIILSGKNIGLQCTKYAVDGGHHCTIHSNSLKNYGPNTTALKELKARLLDRPLKLLTERVNRIDEEFFAQRNAIESEYRNQRDTMKHVQKLAIIQTGVNPDDEALARRIQNRNERGRLRQERLAQLRMRFANQFGGEIFQAGIADPYVQGLDAARGHADVNNNIRDFASDNQNVHTTITVKQTQDVIRKVLSIPVPTDYSWNPDVCSQTPAEIICACKLKQQAVLQMMMKYTSSEPIYDMENGIYGKTLDAVWQFIKNSDDKECLIKTLKTELEDNIGMCAQGNLSRLANVLAGYVDGITPPKSLIDILGEEFSNLSQINDVEKRIDMGANILRQYGVPISEWEAWLEPIADDKEISIENGTVLVH